MGSSYAEAAFLYIAVILVVQQPAFLRHCRWPASDVASLLSYPLMRGTFPQVQICQTRCPCEYLPKPEPMPALSMEHFAAMLHSRSLIWWHT